MIIRSSLGCLLLAGMGGIIPTAARLASAYVSDPTLPLPAVGMYFGLSLFFLIGVALCYAFSEENKRQAFILGICAPGIITNIVAGSQDSRNTVSDVVHALGSLSIDRIVYAQQPGPHDDTERARDNDRRNTAVQKGATITLSVRLAEGTSWDAKKIRVTVAYYEAGEKKVVGEFVPLSTPQFIFVLPQNASRITIDAAGKHAEEPLPRDFRHADLLLDLTVGNRNDFAWALGQKRTPDASSLTLTWTGGDFDLGGVPAAQLIGTSATDSVGKEVGKVVGFRMSDANEQWRVVVEDSMAAGHQLRVFQLDKVKRTPSGASVEIRPLGK